MNPEIILGIIFGVIMVGFLVVDLGYLNRLPHKVSPRSAVLQSLFWIGISLSFAACIYALMGAVPAVEFLSAYITEKMLSVDNLFVILLLFTYFKLEDKYFHRILFWGILGAVLLRGFFIGLGSVMVSHFHWLLYIFGAFLAYTGIKLFKGGDDDEVDFEKNRVLLWCKKHLRLATGEHGGQFTIKTGGLRYFTMMFLVLVLVETTDILFAFDSIPAVFSISQDPFIIFTSNIFAVMGLRALFFLVESILTRFHLLQKALAFVLVFIGGKMLIGIFGIHISSLVSFGVIIVSLVMSAVLSILFPKK